MSEAPVNNHVDNKALEKAYQSLSLIEQIEIVFRDLSELYDSLKGEDQSRCDAIKVRLGALLSALNDGQLELPTLTTKKLTEIGRSKIERLKLGADIIRLRRGHNLSYKEISESLKASRQIEVSEASIRQFCQMYDGASPIEKSRMERASIFDTVRQIEDLAAIIYRQLAHLERVNPEAHVRYISELRQTIKLAQEVLLAMTQQRQIEEIKSVIISILAEIDEAHAQVFIERLKTVGLTMPNQKLISTTIS